MSTGTPAASSTGRVVVVTGGSRGIGLACARKFQSLGDRVAVTYKKAPPGDLGSNLPGAYDLLPVECDVTDASQVDSAFSTIEETLGRIEVLVANAGITQDMLLLRMKEPAWSEVIDTNLTGVYRCVRRAVGPMVRAHSGRIVLISSVVAFMGSPGQVNYAAAKAGLVGMARSLAREVGSRSITVNVIAPGVVETDMIAALGERRLAEMRSMIPIERTTTPDEIASAVAFISSGEAASITGAVLPVDGGLAMGL